MNLTKKQEAKALEKITRVTDYLAAAQLFLDDNFFLERKLEKTDIKKRLLGHWGTCPGANFVMAQINRQISKNIQKTSNGKKNEQEFLKNDREFMFVDGPGHGFPAYQANIMIDGSLSHFYPEKIPYTKDGIKEIIKNFSTPYGHPSHLNPEAPGVILEGGELGYSLAVSAGAVMDNPSMIVTTLIGDGESETGPLAGSWNFNKFISPKKDGAVLPILHLNGYKISGPTVFGRMNNSEIKNFFSGLGYKVYFIDYFKKKNYYIQGMEIFDKAIARIKKIQNKARKGEKVLKPKWPIIILKTPKGYGAPEYVGDKKIVGNCDAHQIIFDNLKNSDYELELLERWLKSYKIEEIISFDEEGKINFTDDVKQIIPPVEKTIGLALHVNNIKKATLLKLPDHNTLFKEQEISKEYSPVKTENSMFEVGKYFLEIIKENDNFRIFSPDETYSNRLFKVFEKTNRVWQWPIKSFDKNMSNEGKVVEVLSEHLLFGMLWGYTFTGRYGFFVTYESFAQITASMMDQYVKFIKVARNVHFRKKNPSFNVILSSLLERQDHNGFSHQNPSYISAALDRDLDIVNVFFPADKNLAKMAMEKSLSLKNSFNISVIGKKMTRTWLTKDEVKKQSEDEIMIWKFISEENPDIVVVTCGDYVTEESIAGVLMFKEIYPDIKIRFVNVFKLDLFIEGRGKFTNDYILEEFLTEDKQIIFNYHGYKTDIKKLLFDYNLSERITINGYEELGSTTSPFDLKARNGISRYNIVIDLVEAAYTENLINANELTETTELFTKKLKEEKEYIIENKDDPEYIKNWDLDNIPE